MKAGFELIANAQNGDFVYCLIFSIDMISL
jgi:hypothetical protein